MESKYGNVCPLYLQEYIRKLSGRIFKLLPLREEGCKTISADIDSICRELNGFIRVISEPSNASDYIITVINILSELSIDTEFKTYRKEILRCRRMIAKAGDLIV